jgi:hypothetical protein
MDQTYWQVTQELLLLSAVVSRSEASGDSSQVIPVLDEEDVS